MHLYLEGLGFRSIGRFLGVSNVSVLNWIRSFGKEAEKLNSESKEIEMLEVDELHSYTGSKKTIVGKEIEMVEVDELHSYIGSKKTIVGYGLLLIDMEKDSSTSLLVTGETKRQRNSGKQ